MSTYFRWKKLASSTCIRIKGVWGIGDEGPPGGNNQGLLAWEAWVHYRSSRLTIAWYSVTFLKLLSKALYESFSCTPIFNEKSNSKATLSRTKIGTTYSTNIFSKH